MTLTATAIHTTTSPLLLSAVVLASLAISDIVTLDNAVPSADDSPSVVAEYRLVVDGVGVGARFTDEGVGVGIEVRVVGDGVGDGVGVEVRVVGDRVGVGVRVVGVGVRVVGAGV